MNELLRMRFFLIQLFCTLLLMGGGCAGIAITCGQSNANGTVARAFCDALPGVNYAVNPAIGGMPIEVWVAEDGHGGYLRGPSYLKTLWDPGDKEAETEAFCHAHPKEEEIYFLWMHGETDVANQQPDPYEAKLRAFFRFVKEDFAFAKKFHIVIGLIWVCDPEVCWPVIVPALYQVRDVQRKVAADLGAVWVDTACLTRMGDIEVPAKDSVHLNYEGETPGTKRFGQLAARAVRSGVNFHADEGVYLVQGKHELRGARGVRYLLESSADGNEWKSCGTYRMPYLKGSESSVPQRLAWPAEAGADSLELRYRLRESAP